MPSSPGRINPAFVISLPIGVLAATLLSSAFGWPLSIWTAVIGLLLTGMVWAVLARLRPAAKPAPEMPRTVWTPQRSGIDEGLLLGVDFLDATRGWVVGENGTILATADGGETWDRQSSGSAAELNAVAFADPSHGWTAGNDQSGAGTVLSTVDGGGTWSAQVTGASFLCDLAFPDHIHGWVVGGNGTILATADSGKTWNAQRSKSTESLLGVTFVDAAHGWAVGVDNETQTGIVVATTNGGETWNTKRVRGDGPLRAVAFADAAHGWAVGEGGTILATADEGKTWKAQSSGAPGGSESGPTLHAVAFPDAAHGWAVGYDGVRECGVILTTVDGGATWLRTTGRGGLFALAFPDATHGWAAGYGEDAETGTETGLILAATESGGE